MSAVESTPSLTPELLDLMEHERVIEQGLASFVEVGCALIAIKANKKYRAAGYSTFDDYCEKRWNMGRKYGHRLIVAASIASTLADELSPMGDIPTPSSERQTRPLALIPATERADAWAEAVEEADGGQPTAAQVERAVAKRQPPRRDHPAVFSDAIIAKIAEHVGPAETVLDPFAGTGRVHELREHGVTTTIGIEIEPEWAAMHPDTIEGDTLAVLRSMPSESVDAIATSPTYGNRMADHHNATDDSVRVTYKHTLGRDLAPTNTGAMQWGPEYRAFHEDAWAEAVRVLKPGDTFTLNIKNHVRDGEVQRVAEWHISTLMLEHQLEMVALDIVRSGGADAGANADKRVGYELVVTFRKAVDE